MSNAFVYFIEDELGNVKIGKARSVNKRKNQGQTWSAGELKELGRIECASEKQAFFLEMLLHSHFDKLRTRVGGEWFKRNTVLNGFIKKHKGSHFNDLSDLGRTILQTSIDAVKYAWVHTLSKEVIEKAYVEEEVYFQDYVEWYGESSRAEIQAMTVYA